MSEEDQSDFIPISFLSIKYYTHLCNYFNTWDIFQTNHLCLTCGSNTLQTQKRIPDIRLETDL
jgi:hypothetical protein